MKFLFYGGCHAKVLSQIFATHAEKGHSFSYLKNFILISRQEPFPYDRVTEFDTVVYSPVENKKGYESRLLVAFCAAHGIRTISYPWLQWNGYFPGLRKVTSGKRLGDWHYPHLAESARDCDSFEAFREKVSGGFHDADAVQAAVERAFSVLRDHEERNAVDLPISDFVAASYRERRLFLTPDHPTLVLYQHLAGRLSAMLGIQLDEAFHHGTREPQAGIMVPILPSVADHLGLTFRQADYEFRPAFGGTLDWRSYLEWIYAGGAIFVPTCETFAKASRAPSAALPPHALRRFAPGDFVVGQRQGIPEQGHLSLKLICSSSDPVDDDLAGSRLAFLFAPHWREVALA